MNPERIHILNQVPERKGCYVLYRMQFSPRINMNLALIEAIRTANRQKLPLVVLYCLDPYYPEANFRHFRFLTEGFPELASNLEKRGIVFRLLSGNPEEVIPPFLEEAFCLITDKGYMSRHRRERGWLQSVCGCRIIEVEDNLIVPVDCASSHAEWAARTLRPKIMEKMKWFVSDAEEELPLLEWKTPVDPDICVSNEKTCCDFLHRVHQSAFLSAAPFSGGESAARAHLRSFVVNKLETYPMRHSDPASGASSRLSPYLHFGMISPLTVWRTVRDLPGAAPFIEQLLVRRELAFNYCNYNSGYDRYETLPLWARNTLAHHRTDPRPYLYDEETLENGATHDVCWNAAMNEMRETGFMENTMRMYWGKKIMEWTESPEEAFYLLLKLNNRYFLDGRDPNSYAGAGWCFGLHDRPWKERAVFGTVRYMNEAGLRRKYDMDTYIRRFSE